MFRGRIRKNETIENAFNKFSARTKFQGINKKEKTFLDIYEHFYPDNFLNNKEFSTHYVVLTYVIQYSNLDKIDMIKEMNNIQNIFGIIWIKIIKKILKYITTLKYIYLILKTQ